ncbi:MAG: hypothetical protein OTJ97_11475 [SAR202 cluster bacterium]|nr:hypothetical protein [SAR202 cluster bacterium]
MTSTTTTLRADQQGCQNGLVLNDRSGGYKVEPLRPEHTIYCVLVTFSAANS